MTPKQALEWVMNEFGGQRAELILRLLINNQNELDAIVVSNFSATNPKRQIFRAALRVLLDAHNMKD